MSYKTSKMRTLVIFYMIAYLLDVTIGKPMRTIADQNSDEGEAEYENKEESTAEDYPQDDQEASMENQEGTRNNARREVQDNSRLPDISNNNPYKQNPHNYQPLQLANFDNFSEMSGASRDVRNEESPNAGLNADTRSMRFRPSDTYTENNEKVAKQHCSDNIYKLNHPAQNLVYGNTGNKKVPLSADLNDEGDLLFENNKDQVNKLSKIDGGMQSRYYNQLYNVPGNIRDLPEYRNNEKLRLNMNRDRRQAKQNILKETNEPSPTGDSKELDTTNEDEEAAIKRHVKKLSGRELEELFNTLSEEKRDLLKKIMESDISNEYEGLNKREITKKAGAVDQNSYIENVQLDSNKVQEVSSNDDDIVTEPSMPRETTETNKRTMSVTEISDAMQSKNSPSCEKSDNKHEITNQNEDIKEVKAESNIDLDSKKSNGDIELESNSQTVSKIENKREANASEIIDIGKSSDDSQTADSDYIVKDFDDTVNNQETYLHDDKISEFINEETERQNSYKNNCKRDVTSLDESSDLSDSIKSLEESFPNSYEDSNSFSGSDMVPLVRVKRKDADSAMMKRAAGNVIADSNVPYFPNKGENDDEDSDEGNEFDDDGFYDRTSNYARSNENNKPMDSVCGKTGDKTLAQNSDLNNYDNQKSESDTANLGSDTDNAITGVEGVNDNLMYSSNLRDRRTSGENDNENNAPEKNKDGFIERRLRSTPLADDEAKTVSETYVNVQGYQENDAFGPLPRNYQGELGRYKRIRRVKQPSASQDNNSPNL